MKTAEEFLKGIGCEARVVANGAYGLKELLTTYAQHCTEAKDKKLEACEKINTELRKQVKDWERIPGLPEAKKEIERLENEAICAGYETTQLAKACDHWETSFETSQDELKKEENKVKSQSQLLKEARGLLEISKCPNSECDGNGAIPKQINEDEWLADQCQWCHEREQTLDKLKNYE